MKIIEFILVIFLLIGILLHNVLEIENTQQIIALSGGFLSLSYLFGNWWLHKPTNATKRTVIFTTLYGLVLFCLVNAILFKLLNLTGATQMIMISPLMSFFIIFLDRITSVNRGMVLEKSLALKVSILTMLGLYLFIFDFFTLKYI